MTDLTQAMMRASLEDDVTAPRDAYDDELLLTGNLVKLGAQFKSWRARFFAVFGDGFLRYYKQNPSNGKPLRLQKPQGQINLKRDVVELLSGAQCMAYMRNTDSQFKGTFSQQVRWPQHADESNAFAIRTTYRTFYMYNPDGAASYWIKGLCDYCHGSDVFIGIDLSSNPSTPAKRIARSVSQPASRNTSRSTSPHSKGRRMSVPSSPLDRSSTSEMMSVPETPDAESSESED